MARAHHEFTAPVSAAWGRRHSWMLRPRPLRQLGWRDSFGSAAGTHSPLLNRIGLQISCARTRTASLVTSMARGRLPFDSDADGRIAVKQKVVALRDERSQPSGGRCGIAAVDKQVGRFAMGCLAIPVAGVVAAEAFTNVGDPALLIRAQ